MTNQTIFTKPFLETKSKKKIQLLWLIFRRIAGNNLRLFLIAALFSVATAIINFNIASNFRIFINLLGGKIYEKKNIFSENVFEFKFIFFGRHWFESKNLGVWWFLIRLIILIFLVKSFFSLFHYYLLNYSSDRIERDLKKELFNHFISAQYSQGAEVSRDLITQFAGDLDTISNQLWIIPNRLIYVIVSVLHYLFFEIIFSEKEENRRREPTIICIAIVLFSILIIAEVELFKKATKLNVVAKRRYEEDNKAIYERINNLEYIKAVSGENYEKKKSLNN